jgi:fructose/tagatose bisphosphate aldolase
LGKVDDILEKATRDFIEKMMDDLLKENISENIEWVSKCIPIQSNRELAVEYVIGNLEGVTAMFAALSLEAKPKRYEKAKLNAYDKEITAMIKRRLPEISEKITKELNK